jgi:hypothetical protein
LPGNLTWGGIGFKAGNYEVARIGTLLLIFALAVPSFGQQKTYNWVQGNDETVRLDPGFYHTSPPYQPGSGARSMHVDVDAHQPVTLAVVSLQSWNDEGQRPESMAGLNLLCVQEHVLQTTYACDIPDRTVPSSGSASDVPAEPATAHWNGDGKLTFRWRLCRFHEPPCRPHGFGGRNN